MLAARSRVQFCRQLPSPGLAGCVQAIVGRRSPCAEFLLLRAQAAGLASLLPAGSTRSRLRRLEDRVTVRSSRDFLGDAVASCLLCVELLAKTAAISAA